MHHSPAVVTQVGCAGQKQGSLREQTVPPSIPVAELFPDGNFPECERQSYKNEYASLLLFIAQCPFRVLSCPEVL